MLIHHYENLRGIRIQRAKLVIYFELCNFFGKNNVIVVKKHFFIAYFKDFCYLCTPKTHLKIKQKI